MWLKVLYSPANHNSLQLCSFKISNSGGCKEMLYGDIKLTSVEAAIKSSEEKCLD